VRSETAFGGQGPSGERNYEPNTIEEAAVVAWNLMGGAVQWEAVEPIASLLGIADIEGLMRGLVTVRDWQESQRA